MDTIQRKTRHLAVILATILVAAMFVTASAANADEDGSSARIQFLNPSPGSSLEISDKASTDSTYALSAWVSDAEAVDLVEFEMSDPVNPLARPITIGTATAVAPDTYELQWAIPATVADGRYLLRAIAYGQSGDTFTELDHDEETVTVLQNAETIEITEPTRGGNLGFFTPEGRPTNGVVSTALSMTTGWARLLYTTSRPGTEPAWKACGAQPHKKLADGLGCVLAAADRPEAVTAISGIANSTLYTETKEPDPNADQTSDAARVFPYIQQPATVTIDPLTTKVEAGSDGVFPCSPAIKASLVDQFGEPILGANIDVHASGPGNGVYFEVVALVSKNQAPDKNHGRTEPAQNCTGTPTTSNEKQGVHRTPGDLSVKHIESLPTGGTDDAGTFSFKLFSESAGTTQITAWADTADDDLFCAGEPAGAGTIGWGVDAEAAVAEEPGACAPTKFARSIALQASKTKVVKGEKVVLAGAITSAETMCTASQEVRLKARKLGVSGRFATVASGVTDDLGVYRFTMVIKRAKEFRAVTPATTSCMRAKSVPTKIRITQ